MRRCCGARTGDTCRAIQQPPSRHESKDHADMFCTETTFGFRTGVEQRGHDRRGKHLRRLCFCVPVADGLLCPHLIVSIVREDWRAKLRKFEELCVWRYFLKKTIVSSSEKKVRRRKPDLRALQGQLHTVVRNKGNGTPALLREAR